MAYFAISDMSERVVISFDLYIIYIHTRSPPSSFFVRFGIPVRIEIGQPIEV